MRDLGVFAALVLSGITASCAERLAPPVNIASPSPAPSRAAPNLRPDTPGANRPAAVTMEDARKPLAARPRQIIVHAGKEPPPKTRTSSRPFQATREPWQNPPLVAALPPPPEPAEPALPPALHPVEAAPASALIDPLPPDAPVGEAIPPPPEPAAPLLPSAPMTTEAAPAQEPVAPSVSQTFPQAAMPPPPEPAEPSFPTAALMPPPPDPAEPFLPEQEAIAAETPVSLPFPELSENLSLRPRIDWREVTATFSIPRGLLSGAFEPDPERTVPSLIRDPWPLRNEP